MRIQIAILTSCVLSLSTISKAQDKKLDNDPQALFTKGKYNIEIGLGAAAYEGDLTEKTSFFSQPGLAASFGSSYNISKQFGLGLGLSYARLRADDKKNDKPSLIARNLNFKSNVWELNLLLQYRPVNLGKYTPYVEAGGGLFHFNPTTIDRYGNKQKLHDLGTEGQGMMLPGRPEYAITQFQIPFGAGIQYSINNRMALKLDFLFRKTFTDYIDDVSTTYPDATLIDKKLAIVKQLTFRGDEINSSAQYPSGGQRGNPDNKDFYYTGQIKFVYQLNKKLL